MLWSRWSLRRVTYERIIPEDHAFSGEPIAVTLRITNRKPLPLAWIEAHDCFPESIVPSADGFMRSAQQGLLAFSWRTSAAGYQRVSRAVELRAPERGMYEIGPAVTRSGDPFGLFDEQREEPRRSRVIVYPRTVPLAELGLPSRRPYGEQPRGLPVFEDPARAAGIRDYTPGDSLRRIDWNATARLGRLQSRVYDPTSSQHLLLCVNTQTIEPAWAGYVHDLLERAITVAASLARDAYDRRYAVGLLANASVPDADRSIRIAPGRRPEQFIRMLEALALVTPFVLEPLAAQLDREEHRLTAGTTVVVVTALMPAGLAASLQRLRRRGHPVAVLSTSGDTWTELLGDIVVRDVSRVERDLAQGGGNMTVRRVRLPLALLVDVLGAYAIASVAVQVLSGANGPGPSLLAVAAVAGGSFALARLLREMDLDETAMRNAGAVASLVALYTILHFEYAPSSAPWDFGWLRTLIAAPNEFSGGAAHVFAGVIVLTVLWLRGVMRGGETLDARAVFGSGTVGLAAVALAAATLPTTRGPDVFGALALFYVVAFLAVLALYQAPDADVPVRAFAARWSAAVAGLIGGALALTVVAAAIDPAAFGVLAPIGAPLLLVIETVARYTLGPIIGGIAWVIDAIIPAPHAVKPPDVPHAPTANNDQQGTPLWFRIVAYVMAGGFLAVVAASLVAGLWLAFRRYSRSREDTGERRDNVERESGEGDGIGALLGSLLWRPRRPRDDRSPVEIRRLYHEMLEQAARGGVERPDAATASQFAPRLDAHFASDAPSAISDAFAASRYGLVTFSDDDVRALRDRWRSVIQP